MSGKARPSLIKKTLVNVDHCNLSQTDKDCIKVVLEKHIPKKPKTLQEEYFICSKCNMAIIFTNEPAEHFYCLNCGQKIDWSETDG